MDDGWGRLRGTTSAARPFKTKGSWAYARITPSCNNPLVDPPRMEVRSLVVLVAKQVAANMPEKDTLKHASL